MREIHLKVLLDWEEYDNVHPELVIEDTGTLNELKDGVSIEVVGDNKFHQVGRS